MLNITLHGNMKAICYHLKLYMHVSEAPINSSELKKTGKLTELVGYVIFLSKCI